MQPSSFLTIEKPKIQILLNTEATTKIESEGENRNYVVTILRFYQFKKITVTDGVTFSE